MLTNKIKKEIIFETNPKFFQTNKVEKSLNVFNKKVKYFLDELSFYIFKNPQIKSFPDLASFGFFCRKANIKFLENKYPNFLENRYGRGLVLHFTPSNVPLNFAYSLFFGLITGNSNIIRLSNAFGAPSNASLNCWKLVVNDFCKQVVLNKEILINSDGNQVRNFVSLNEVSRLIDFIISQFCKGKFIPTVFNFGGDWTLSILDMAKLVAKQYKKNFEFSPPIIIRKKSTNLIPKLNFNFDLIVKSGFKPNNNNMADINELFLYVKNNFSDVR